MKISEAIAKIKSYHRGISRGEPIDQSKSRDQILYGDPEQELKGIVTSCFASYAVIEGAIQAGANLIICHEAVFWNHGDHTDWLLDNKAFISKTRLLDTGGIVIWRNHDFVYSGTLFSGGGWAAGLFYGL